MSEEKKGIKEVKEILAAVNGIAVDSINAIKDGLDIGDISVLLVNLEKIKDAVEGAGDVPEELKDLDQAEIIELVSLSVAMVFAVLDALKEKKVA